MLHLFWSSPTPARLATVPGMRLVTLKRRTLDGGADLTWVATLAGLQGAHVHGAQLDAGDTLPRHPTPVWQVFAVLSGTGEVAGQDDVRRPIGPGTAAVWSPGEEHTSWAVTDMVVVIVQSDAEPTIDP